VAESLEDHLRRATRNFTARLPEDQVFALGRDLALELVRAHAETPPRFPDLEPTKVALVDGKPSLTAAPSQAGAAAHGVTSSRDSIASRGGPKGREADQLFALGALLHFLASGEKPHVSWRLDGPPPAEANTVRRRAVLAALGSTRGDGYPTASVAAAALERALVPQGAGSAPWSLFRGAPTRAGRASPGPLPGALVAGWQATVGPVVSSPLITGDFVIGASADGRLVFLDRETGARVHEARLASALESSPALLDRTFLIGTDDGEVVAVDAVDARVLYRVKLGEVVRSSPLLHGDRAFVGVVEAGAAGALVALDVRTGKILWKRKLGPVFSSPALAGDLVLVGSDDERLHALDSRKGEPSWSRPLSGRVRATPAVLGEHAVVGDFKGRVAAVGTKDGSVLWTRDLPQAVYSSAALTPALAVVGCHDGQIYGLSMATGERVFEVTTGGPVVSSPLAIGDRFLAASTDGYLYLFDATGQVLARLAVATGGIQSSPAIDAAGLVIGSARGLHAVRFTT